MRVEGHGIVKPSAQCLPQSEHQISGRELFKENSVGFQKNAVFCIPSPPVPGTGWPNDLSPWALGDKVKSGNRHWVRVQFWPCEPLVTREKPVVWHRQVVLISCKGHSTTQWGTLGHVAKQRKTKGRVLRSGAGWSRLKAKLRVVKSRLQSGSEVPFP